MKLRTLLPILLLIPLSGCNRPVGQAKPFPADFAWGAGNASSHGVTLGESGVGMISAIGLTHYRVSLDWERLMPAGIDAPFDLVAVAEYQGELDRLSAAGIQPVVVLYDGGLPEWVDDAGGWSSPSVSGLFATYADTAFDTFGDQVPMWITLADPFGDRQRAHSYTPEDSSAAKPADSGSLSRAPPFVQARRRARDLNPEQSTGELLALRASEAHNMLLAHAAAVERFKARGHGGSIGLSVAYSPVHPRSEDAGDAAAARMEDGIRNRWFLDPLLTGVYPDDVESALRPHGLASLPQSDIDRIAAAPGDFLGLEYFAPTRVEVDSLSEHLQYRLIPNLDGDKSAYGEADAQGLYDTLIRVHGEYDAPGLIVTANGASYGPIDEYNDNGRIRDELRVRFLRRHFVQAQRAADEGVDLEGYFVWTAFDSPDGSNTSGLLHWSPENGTYLFKDSARYVRSIVAANAVSRMPF